MVWRRNLPVVCWPVALLCCMWMLDGTPVAQTAESKRPEAAALVRQLDDDSYEARQQAAKQLADLGLKARDALVAGLDDPSAEVRRRCRWLLRDVLEADFRNRLQAFEADRQGNQDHDLPGWEQYRRTVGDDRDARELFVKMQRAESGLMISIAAGPESAKDALKLRFRQVYTRMSNPDVKRRKTPSVETIAAYDGDSGCTAGRGKQRRVTRRIRLTYCPQPDKQAVYAGSVGDLLSDQIAFIRNPAHLRRVTEENGLNALGLAETAANLAEEMAE